MHRARNRTREASCVDGSIRQKAPQRFLELRKANTLSEVGVLAKLEPKIPNWEAETSTGENVALCQSREAAEDCRSLRPQVTRPCLFRMSVSAENDVLLIACSGYLTGVEFEATE